MYNTNKIACPLNESITRFYPRLPPPKTNKQTNKTGKLMVEICQHNGEGRMPLEHQRSPDVAYEYR